MISFEAILIGDKTIARNNMAHKSFTLKVIEDTSVRTIPPQFKGDFDTSMFNASAVNDTFNRINIPLRQNNINYEITFAGTKFNAQLESMSANIKQKKDGTFTTTYTFTFVKELDPTVDGILSSMFMVTETDDKGKKQLIKYQTDLVKI
jgi:hypothetical protein